MEGRRNQLENELRRLGVLQINSTPNHPTTCGKVERFQQTHKRWLTHQQPATTIVELQTQIDAFTHGYNHRRPHRSLPHRATPATTYQAALKRAENPPRHPRPRPHRPRRPSRLNHPAHQQPPAPHIGLGRIHYRTHVLILVQDLNITITTTIAGELLRALTFDPTRDYQPTGALKGPTRKKPQT